MPMWRRRRNEEFNRTGVTEPTELGVRIRIRGEKAASEDLLDQAT